MSVYIAVPKEDAYDIKHYGIMGQKWGIRRYQNKDGTLTPEGKARYGTVENFNKVMKAIKTGSAIGGPVGGVIGGAIADKKYRTKSSKNTKNRSTTTGKKNVTDEEAIAAAKKAGLHQGDNYKVYRKAMSGDKEAQKIVKGWESQKKKPSIDKEVARARKTGKYDMEFLERELDLDQRTGELLKGKALDDAYRKYLNAKQEPKSSQKVFDATNQKEVENFLKIVSDKEAALKPGDDPQDAWDEALIEYDKRRKTKKKNKRRSL